MTKIKSLIDQVFMLSPETKQQLEEVAPTMDEKTKAEFIEYLEGIINKQNEILTFIIKNNPSFISDLRAFNARINRESIREIEEQFREKEEIDLVALEKQLSKL